MELSKKDFDAKAAQIQAEVSEVLSHLVKQRGNVHLPPELVSEVFHRAIASNLAWAYNEGLGVHVTKLTPGSEDKKG